MALGIGRRKQEDARDSGEGLNQKLVRELTSAGERTFTGAVVVEDRGGGGSARLYVWDGGLYAAELDGYEPPVLDRLRSSGAVAGENWQELSALAGEDRCDPRIGVLAAERGWITSDALALVHQEYVMAALGAVLARPKLRVELVRDEQTADYCTLPVPIEPLFGAVRRRSRRTEGTWDTLGATGTAATVVPVRTGQDVPARLSMAEFTAMTNAVDGRRTLDAVAEVVGFTRAEAVHMAGLLVLAGVITVKSSDGASPPGHRLLVPEDFGRPVSPGERRARGGRIAPAVAQAESPPATAIVVPEPETAPAPAPEPEPEPEEEPRLVESESALIVAVPDVAPEPPPAVSEPPVAPAPGPLSQPVTAVAPEAGVRSARPAPEALIARAVGTAPAPSPASEARPTPVPAAAVTTPPAAVTTPPTTVHPSDHVRLLRLEIARAELAELEEVLRESAVAEQEAIARTAAIRARVRDAQAVIDDLSEPGESVADAQ